MDILRSSFRRYVLAECADFSFGNCRASPSSRRFAGPAGEALVEPRVMQVLLALYDAEGRVVGREELLDSCWDGRIVGDDAINRAVAELRRALLRAGANTQVETVARVGYRLQGPGTSETEANAELPPAAKHSRRTVLGSALVAGVALVGLGGFAWFRQSEAAATRREQTVHDIRTAILTSTPASLLRAEELLGQSGELGLDEARHSGLEAMLHLTRGDVLAPNERVELNRLTLAAVEKAIAADSLQADARVAQAVLQRGIVPWQEHEASLRAILASEPDNIFAMAELGPFLQSVGRSEEARAVNFRAAELLPMAGVLQQRRALIHWIFGAEAEAVRIITRAGELWPDHQLIAVTHLLLLAFTGRIASAQSLLEDPASRQRLGLPEPALAAWRVALAAIGSGDASVLRKAAATLVEAATTSPGLAANCTLLLSHMGFADEAYHVADRLVLGAVQQGPGDPNSYSDPRWRETQWLFSPAAKTLREDRRFTRFAEELGYFDYWQASGKWPDEALRGSLELARNV